jgi:hypothetical protein
MITNIRDGRIFTPQLDYCGMTTLAFRTRTVEENRRSSEARKPIARFRNEMIDRLCLYIDLNTRNLSYTEVENVLTDCFFESPILFFDNIFCEELEAIEKFTIADKFFNGTFLGLAPNEWADFLRIQKANHRIDLHQYDFSELGPLLPGNQKVITKQPKAKPNTKGRKSLYFNFSFLAMYT